MRNFPSLRDKNFHDIGWHNGLAVGIAATSAVFIVFGMLVGVTIGLSS